MITAETAPRLSSPTAPAPKQGGVVVDPEPAVLRTHTVVSRWHVNSGENLFSSGSISSRSASSSVPLELNTHRGRGRPPKMAPGHSPQDLSRKVMKNKTNVEKLPAYYERVVAHAQNGDDPGGSRARRSLRPRQEKNYAEAPDVIMVSDEEKFIDEDDDDSSDSDCGEMPPLPREVPRDPAEMERNLRLVRRLRNELRQEEMKLVLLKKLRHSQTQGKETGVSLLSVPGTKSTAENMASSGGSSSPLPQNLSQRNVASSSSGMPHFFNKPSGLTITPTLPKGTQLTRTSVIPVDRTASSTRSSGSSSNGSGSSVTPLLHGHLGRGPPTSGLPSSSVSGGRGTSSTGNLLGWDGKADSSQRPPRDSVTLTAIKVQLKKKRDEQQVRKRKTQVKQNKKKKADVTEEGGTENKKERAKSETGSGKKMKPGVKKKNEDIRLNNKEKVPPTKKKRSTTPREEPTQTPAQRQAAAKLALRKQLEKTLLQIPPPKPPPPEMHFIPNVMNQEFLCLLGLEASVNYLLKDESHEAAPNQTPFRCAECGTDFTPVWKWDKKQNATVCESCVSTNTKKSLKAEHTNRLKSAFVKALQQEQDLERQLSKCSSASSSPTTTPPAPSPASVREPQHRVSPAPSSSSSRPKPTSSPATSLVPPKAAHESSKPSSSTNFHSSHSLPSASSSAATNLPASQLDLNAAAQFMGLHSMSGLNMGKVDYKSLASQSMAADYKALHAQLENYSKSIAAAGASGSSSSSGGSAADYKNLSSAAMMSAAAAAAQQQLLARMAQPSGMNMNQFMNMNPFTNPLLYPYQLAAMAASNSKPVNAADFQRQQAELQRHAAEMQRRQILLDMIPGSSLAAAQILLLVSLPLLTFGEWYEDEFGAGPLRCPEDHCVHIDECQGIDKAIVLRNIPCKPGGEYVCCAKHPILKEILSASPIADEGQDIRNASTKRDTSATAHTNLGYGYSTYQAVPLPSYGYVQPQQYGYAAQTYDYYQPVQETYTLPTYAPPTYAPPTYAPPTYAPPTYAPPTYAPPSYEEPKNSYGAPQTSYGAPEQSYGAPEQSYGAPEQSYGAPEQSYGAPQQSYGAPQQSYGAPQQSYGAPEQSYGAPQQSYGYGAPEQSYGAPQQSYGAPQQSYGAPQQSYGAPQQSYGAPQQSYGTPEPSYGAPQSTSCIPQPSYEEDDSERLVNSDVPESLAGVKLGSVAAAMVWIWSASNQQLKTLK
ncbi:unnamed protein product [Cyprideis torosa]|uniref:Transcriptional repressor p66 coiled-coil MBD2-interaction domain-containing protein n=1 Tax=Cyprideis torosa TaxID=163714 RepID=A0A7R8W4H2_9CRUS|nr:unnamed protein product [Cyprideis torosa]CAG0879552.1 unnamed protein product [Cyprideis torosa]